MIEASGFLPSSVSQYLLRASEFGNFGPFHHGIPIAFAEAISRERMLSSHLSTVNEHDLDTCRDFNACFTILITSVEIAT